MQDIELQEDAYCAGKTTGICKHVSRYLCTSQQRCTNGSL